MHRCQWAIDCRRRRAECRLVLGVPRRWRRMLWGRDPFSFPAISLAQSPCVHDGMVAPTCAGTDNGEGLAGLGSSGSRGNNLYLDDCAGSKPARLDRMRRTVGRVRRPIAARATGTPEVDPHACESHYQDDIVPGSGGLLL